jgi:hypothetical protein
VGALHLLTTAGAWSVTDHGEQLLVAERLLTRHTFDLWDPGDPPLRRYGEFAQMGDPTRAVRSRFLPGPSLTFLPLLWLDREIGWGEPTQFGRLVHLQGEIFVLAGLGIIGWALRRSRVSQGGTALVVALTGLAWPTWLIARRVGPEPILFALVALFFATLLCGGSRAAAPLQAACCALLPWTHPTGPMIAVALVLGVALDQAVRRGLSGVLPAVLPPLVGTLVGSLTVLVFWNHLYEGSWLHGGYAAYAVPLVSRDPLPALLACPESLVLGAPVLVLCLLLGLARSPGWRPPRAEALVLTLVLPAATALTLLFVFNLPLDRGEATRRVAALMPAWGAVVGGGLIPVRYARPLVLGSILQALLFLPEQANYYFTPGGIVVSPCLWVRLLQVGTPWPVVALMVGLLLGLLLWGARGLLFLWAEEA